MEEPNDLYREFAYDVYGENAWWLFALTDSFSWYVFKIELAMHLRENYFPNLTTKTLASNLDYFLPEAKRIKDARTQEGEQNDQ